MSDPYAVHVDDVELMRQFAEAEALTSGQLAKRIGETQSLLETGLATDDERLTSELQRIAFVDRERSDPEPPPPPRPRPGLGVLMAPPRASLLNASPRGDHA